MTTILKNITDYFMKRQKSLFLFDGAGAALTAFLLGSVLPRVQGYIGMPKPILTNLAWVAVIFCLYSITCFLVVHKNGANWIRIIAVANVLYCAATFTLIFLNFEKLTAIGLSYFVLEIIIILSLAYVEWRVASALKKGSG